MDARICAHAFLPSHKYYTSTFHSLFPRELQSSSPASINQFSLCSERRVFAVHLIEKLMLGSFSSPLTKGIAPQNSKVASTMTLHFHTIRALRKRRHPKITVAFIYHNTEVHHSDQTKSAKNYKHLPAHSVVQSTVQTRMENVS